jgi:hypothetical protein
MLSLFEQSSALPDQDGSTGGPTPIEETIPGHVARMRGEPSGLFSMPS